jgi:hypothetical protein
MKTLKEQKSIEKSRNTRASLKVELGLPVEVLELDERICDAYRAGDFAEAKALESRQDLLERQARRRM